MQTNDNDRDALDEAIARSRAYHWAGRLWAEANTISTDAHPASGPYSPAEFVSACGLIAEACCYMVDDVEGDVEAIEIDRYHEHLDAAIAEASRGRHCPVELAQPGLDYLERDEGYAGVVRDAILRNFSSLVHVAELELCDRPMGRDRALRLLRLGAVG